MNKRSVMSCISVRNSKRYNKFDTLNQQNRKSNQILGSVLDDQLVCQARATRCTQTNWKWREMAVRWRNAKIIEPRCIPISDSMIPWDKEALKKRMVKDLREVRALTSHDKIVDTYDLEFDPNNVPAEYNCHSSYCQGGPPDMRFYANKWITFVEYQKIQKKSSGYRSNKTSLRGNESCIQPMGVQAGARGSQGRRDSVQNK